MPPETVASQWSALDQYAVKQAYYAISATRASRSSISNRLNFAEGTMSVEYLTDLTSLQLK